MNSNIFQDPAFQNLSPEKLQFLMEFQQMAKPSSMKDAAPFFMQSLKEAKSKGILFSGEESSLLIEILKQNMSAQEQKKADMILNMMKMRQKK